MKKVKSKKAAQIEKVLAMAKSAELNHAKGKTKRLKSLAELARKKSFKTITFTCGGNTGHGCKQKHKKKFPKNKIPRDFFLICWLFHATTLFVIK